MSPKSPEFRCRHCNALLAKREADTLSIRRNDLHATVAGDFTVTVACYRCHAVNIATSARPPAPPPAAP